MSRSTPRKQMSPSVRARGVGALRARTPTGAPPRHLRGRPNAAAQLQPALPGTWRHQVLPASDLSIQSSGLPRSTGRSAGRAYPPKPPECGVQIRPREPHSPRIQVCLENTSLRRARCSLVTDIETNVNSKVTPLPPVIAELDPAIHGAWPSV